MAGEARPAITRVSSGAHSSSVTACRSGVMSALPIASRRQKWARAPSDGSSSGIGDIGDSRAVVSAPGEDVRSRKQQPLTGFLSGDARNAAHGEIK